MKNCGLLFSILLITLILGIDTNLYSQNLEVNRGFFNWNKNRRLEIVRQKCEITSLQSSIKRMIEESEQKDKQINNFIK